MLAFELQISTVIILFVISALAGLAAWCFFVWAIKDKQFENTEDVSKRLLELDDATVAESDVSRREKKEEARV
ncbi:MAG: cbb3-type cytochrome oxidase assembly protein CcoS [Planctomycetes bacterium]|nr:cbb3-type cytochrome oxidase assembly protein CcoS [Planctomycetota bacterium]